MRTKDIDYKFSLGFLKKLNRLTQRDTLLANSFTHEEYNLWHLYQQNIFEDIKAFSVSQKFSPRKKASFFSILHLKNFIIGLALAVFSLASFLFLVASKRKVLVYSIDRANSSHKSDFRLETLYGVLEKKNVTYFEIFHTIPTLQTFRNIFARKRFSAYLEAIQRVFYWKKKFGLAKMGDMSFIEKLDFSGFQTSDEKLFAKELVRRYAETTALSIYKINTLHRLLGRTSLQALFAIDDVRFYQELLLACKKTGIQTYALQHGHFTKYHVGWLKNEEFEGKFIYPDALLVWSEYWKQELLHLGTYFLEEHILIAGIENMPEKEQKKEREIESVEKERAKRENITILVPYETSCPKSEVAEYIMAFLKCENVQVIFKLRPDIARETQLAEYGLPNDKRNMPANFRTVSNIESVGHEITFVAGTYSTYLYDMISLGKHVIMLETSTDYGERMVVNGIADTLGKENISETLKKLRGIPEEELSRRRAKLIGNNPKLLSETLEEILKNFEP
ncbi:hypothetical protein L0Y69_02050 [bacterium]|nr:hypothetical protein [bacterium]